MDVDPVKCEMVKAPWVVHAYPRRKGNGHTIHVNHPQINPVNKDHICYAHEMHGATPDGSVDMCRLWHTMADGDNNRYLVRQPAGLHFTHEVIAPDGKSLIFPYMHGVGQVDFDTLEKRSIYYNPDCCPGHLTVSPDQKWIAGDTWGDWKDHQGNSFQSIMMFNVESREFAHLCWIPRSRGHPGHPHPNFSPDGTKIAFTQLVDDCPQVAYIDVSDIMLNWSRLAQGTGQVASTHWQSLIISKVSSR
jgi:Tol biopolymer transport system component